MPKSKILVLSPKSSKYLHCVTQDACEINGSDPCVICLFCMFFLFYFPNQDGESHGCCSDISLNTAVGILSSFLPVSERETLPSLVPTPPTTRTTSMLQVILSVLIQLNMFAHKTFTRGMSWRQDDKKFEFDRVAKQSPETKTRNWDYDQKWKFSGVWWNSTTETLAVLRRLWG